MKTAKKSLSLLLAVIIAFSCACVAFAEGTSKTEAVLKSIASSGKFKANITSWITQETVWNNRFNLYDDLNANKIRVDLPDKICDLLYAEDEVTVLFRFPLYLTVSPSTFPLAKVLTGGIDIFQKVIKTFVNDPMLSAFELNKSTVTENGKTYECEYFLGKTVGTSGSFYYDEAGNLAKVVLTDNQGESIGMTLEGFSASFENSVFEIPAGYFSLAFLKVLLSILLLFIK